MNTAVPQTPNEPEGAGVAAPAGNVLGGAVLSVQNAALVKQAGERARKIRRAAGIAGFNGWTAAVFAACALASGFWSLPALVLGLGLGVGAFLELRGRRMLSELDERGPRLLALNQAVIAGAVTVYCLWQIWDTMHAPASTPELLTGDPGMDEIIGSTASLAHSIMLGVYGLVIVLTGIFQGLMALYYLSRGKLLAEHRRLTPPWIADIQRRLAA